MCLQHLSYLFEGLKFDVGENVALWHVEDLEGHRTVVILQGGDIVIANGQLCPSVNLIPAHRGEIKTIKTLSEDYNCCGTE